MLSKIYGRLVAPLLVRSSCRQLGKNPRFAGYCTVNGGQYIRIGDDFFCGNNFYVSANPHAKVCIGDAVMLGPEVMILAGDHSSEYRLSHMRFNSQHNVLSNGIDIEDGAWIGARSVLLSGAALGEGCIVGASSVVRSFVPPYTIAVGNKLRIAKCRFQSVQELTEMLTNVSSKYHVDALLELYRKHGITMKTTT